MRRSLLLLALAPALVMTPAQGAAAPLPVNISSAFNVDCTQERGAELVTGDCQGSVFTESFIVGDALGPGFPSGTVTFRKQPFTMGDVTLTNNNAANGSGQVITFPAKSGYKYLQVLTMHTAGGKPQGGPMTVTYTDKSTATIPLVVPAWDSAPATAAWSGHKQGLLHSPTGGTAADVVLGSKSHLFIEQLPINSKKAIASVKLPTFAGLRVFAMTLSNTSSAPAKGPVFN